MEVRVVWAACPPLEGDLGSFDSPAVAFLPRPFGPVVPEKESYTASPLRYFETHDARSFRNDARRGQSGTLSSCSKRSRRTIFKRSFAMMSVLLVSMASSNVGFRTRMS